jgi:hypothetical protein
MSKAKDADLFGLYGVDRDAFERSKDILPTFDLGKLEVGSRVALKFLDDSPKIVTTKDKFSKGNMKETPVIRVMIDTVFRMGDDGKLIEIPMNMAHSLWLSSKSLAMGVLRVHQEHGTLKDKRAIINIGITDYKDFGENRCYSVTQ